MGGNTLSQVYKILAPTPLRTRNREHTDKIDLVYSRTRSRGHGQNIARGPSRIRRQDHAAGIE